MDFTLEQLFGPGASQSATTVTISKAGLLGLTPGINRAEAILAALINNLLNECNGWIVDESNDIITDEIGDPIEYQSTYKRLAAFYWRNWPEDGFIVHQIVVQFKFQTSSTYGSFDPDDLEYA